MDQVLHFIEICSFGEARKKLNEGLLNGILVKTHFLNLYLILLDCLIRIRV